LHSPVLRNFLQVFFTSYFPICREMTDKVHFKLVHKGETHRFTTLRNLKFPLGAVIGKVFSIKETTGHRLFWRDDETRVSLETNDDIEAAIDFAQLKWEMIGELPCIRLETEPFPQFTTEEEEEVEREEENMIEEELLECEDELWPTVLDSLNTPAVHSSIVKSSSVFHPQRMWSTSGIPVVDKLCQIMRTIFMREATMIKKETESRVCYYRVDNKMPFDREIIEREEQRVRRLNRDLNRAIRSQLHKYCVDRLRAEIELNSEKATVHEFREALELMRRSIDIERDEMDYVLFDIVDDLYEEVKHIRNAHLFAVESETENAEKLEESDEDDESEEIEDEE
ncbi:hypothetical protein PFISCL1PPCAC_1635, partial [Pristionchus fissidentatus]